MGVIGQSGDVIHGGHAAGRSVIAQSNHQLRRGAVAAAVDGVGEALRASNNRGRTVRVQRIAVTAVLIDRQRTVDALNDVTAGAQRKALSIGVGDGGDDGVQRGAVVIQHVAGLRRGGGYGTGAGLFDADVQ